MSSAKHEPVDLGAEYDEPEDAIVEYLEQEGRADPKVMRIDMLREGYDSERYEEAVESLRCNGEIVLGIEDLGDDNEPYLRLQKQEEY